MRDWLDDGHLALFVIDVVDGLDTSALHRRPGGTPGRPPYDPQMMCALLLYAYCMGVRSSRQIEAFCRTDAAFRVISGALVPDHATIARFVVDHEQTLAGLFVSGLRLCAAAGLCDLSLVALDGTKMAADAALDKNRDTAWIDREVAKLMAATAADAHALASPAALPGVDAPAAGEVISHRGRLTRLRAARAVIEAAEAAAAEAAAEKAAAAAAEAENGRKLPGRKPKDPVARLARAHADLEASRVHAAQQPDGSAARARADTAVERAQAALADAQEAVQAHQPAPAQANITDPDSRTMKTHDGWVQGYNAQAIVNRNQIVLACDVTQHANDVELYEPMMTLLDQTAAAAGLSAPVGLALADAGYWSDANATAPGPDRLIATLKDHKQRRAARELGQTSGPPPTDATPIEAMEHRLRTPEGAAAYAQRSCTIEPTFGNCKHNRGMRRFRRRGHDAAKSEWAFMQLANNMLKLHQHRAATATA